MLYRDEDIFNILYSLLRIAEKASRDKEYKEGFIDALTAVADAVGITLTINPWWRD